jgi:hypothetical protein
MTITLKTVVLDGLLLLICMCHFQRVIELDGFQIENIFTPQKIAFCVFYVFYNAVL